MADLFNPAQVNSNVGNTIFVDAVNGNDSTGAQGDASKSFATIAAALAGATAPACLYVFPGDYPVDNVTLPGGVNIHLEAGATLRPAADYAEAGAVMFTDGGQSVQCTITGAGDIIGWSDGDESGKIFDITGDTTSITVQCRVFGAEGGGSFSHVSAATGTSPYFSLTAREVGGSFNTSSGVTDVNAKRGNVTFNASGTGEQRIYVDYFDAGACTCNSAGAKQFIHSEATYAKQTCNAGFQSIQVAQLNFLPATGTALECNGGSQSVSCGTVRGGGDGSPTIKVTAGELNLRANKVVNLDTPGVSSYGLDISGGTARINNATFKAGVADTANIRKSGGALFLNACALTGATTNSISSATAQNVVSYGSFASKVVDGNTTIQGSLTVGTYVV